MYWGQLILISLLIMPTLGSDRRRTPRLLDPDPEILGCKEAEDVCKSCKDETSPEKQSECESNCFDRCTTCVRENVFYYTGLAICTGLCCTVATEGVIVIYNLIAY